MKPISEMTPIEIREAVATRVMGWEPYPFLCEDDDTRHPGVWELRWHHPALIQEYLPMFSTEIGPAFEVVAKMRENGYVFFYLSSVPEEHKVRHKAIFAKATPLGRRSPKDFAAVADSESLAICLAALEAIGSAK